MNSNHSPKVTVLMSAFNAGGYIRDSIESILNQTFKDFEFLLFDDGSTDDTAAIIAEFAKKDSRVQAFYKEKNSGFEGMIVNLNKGLSMTKGEYVARMDADDISYPERLARQVEFLDANPAIFLVGTGAVNIDQHGKVLSLFVPEANPAVLKRKMEKVPAIYNPTVMFRTGSGLKYVAIRTCEDYDLFLQALKNGLKLANISDPLISYRVLPPSLSHGDQFLRSMNTLAVQDAYKGVIKREDLNAQFISSRYDPKKCSKELLSRMVELAYLSRGYDILFDIAEIYRDRFGFSLKVTAWAVISRLKLLLKKRL